MATEVDQPAMQPQDVSVLNAGPKDGEQQSASVASEYGGTT